MAAPQELGQIDLRRYLGVLARRWRLIAVVVLVMVLATTGFSLLQTPVYEAEAKVLLEPRGTGLFPSDSQLRLDPALIVETEVEILKSEPVVSAVVEKLGPVDTVVAERVGETLIIAVRARSEEPRLAAEVANSYTEAYIAYRRQQVLDELSGAGGPIRDRIAEIQSEIGELDAAIDGTASSGRTSRDALLIEQSRYRERLQQLEVETSANSGGAQLVSPSTIPDSPVSPKPLRNSMLAVVGGLLLGVVLTSVLETLDESVKSKDDLRAATDGLPVLASIPSFEGTDGYLVEDGTVAGEAYRMLRTSVQLLGVARPLRTVLITSASSGEGKTTTVVNLAKVFATTGQNVVVVDCDLRRPRLHEVLECSNRIGFTSLLLDEVTLDGALQPVPGHERLMLVASGHLSPNPSELLSSKQAAQVFFDLQSRFDVVLIDCPPVLPVTDATLLSAWVDATVLVASADQTSRKQLKSTIEVLRQVDAPLKGTVLNRARMEKSQYYSYAAGGPMRTGAVPVASNDGHIDRQAEAPGRVEPKGTEALPRSGGTAAQL